MRARRVGVWGRVPGLSLALAGTALVSAPGVASTPAAAREAFARFLNEPAGAWAATIAALAVVLVVARAAAAVGALARAPEPERARPASRPAAGARSAAVRGGLATASAPSSQGGASAVQPRRRLDPPPSPARTASARSRGARRKFFAERPLKRGRRPARASARDRRAKRDDARRAVLAHARKRKLSREGESEKRRSTTVPQGRRFASSPNSSHLGGATQ